MQLRAKIKGTGYYVPDRVLTNADLEQMVDTSDDWIVRRTGIKERRILDEGMYTSDMAVIAGKRALENAGVSAEEIELILVSTVTPDMFTPSVSCMVQDQIGAVNAMAMDINTACTGFMSVLVTANQFIASGYYKKILVIGAEALTRMTDYKDRNTCILFGDGAGAAVLEAAESGGVLSSYMGADGSSGYTLTSLAFRDDEAEMAKRISGRKETLWMDGSEVLKFAVRMMTKATEVALERAGLTIDDIAMIVPHQANIRIVSGAAKRLGVSMDKMVINIDRLGNIGSGCIPIALSEAMGAGTIRPGDKVVLVAMGGGLTWGAAIVEL